MTIRFYRPDENPYGCFSNFSDHGFEAGGVFWPMAEHYFQAMKFDGAERREQVRAAESPGAAKALGTDRSVPIRGDWEEARDDVMRRAVSAKFEAHAELREVLLATGYETIIEDAKSDAYWGCGPDGSGANMLGRILMEVRDNLRSAPAEELR